MLALLSFSLVGSLFSATLIDWRWCINGICFTCLASILHDSLVDERVLSAGGYYVWQCVHVPHPEFKHT